MSTCTPRSPLPLTTPFPVPPSCTATLILTTYNATKTIYASPPPGARFSSSFSYTSTYPTTDLSAYGLVAGYATAPPGGGPRFHDAGCFPPRYGELRGAWFVEHGVDGGGGGGQRNGNGNTAGGGGGGCGLPTYYSPGMCPVSWTSTNIVVVVQPTVTGEEVETAATCCPPEFTIPADLGTDVPVYCESVVRASTDVWAPDSGSWTTVDAGTVRAAAVEMRWREVDRRVLDGSGGGAEGGRLSAGAKAGIGVGAGLACLAMGVGGVALHFRRRRRARKRKGKSRDDGEFGKEDKGWAKSADGSPQELDGERTTQELPVEERRVEMDGGERHVEMDAKAGEVRRAGAVREEGKSRAGHMQRHEQKGGKVHEDVAELE